MGRAIKYVFYLAVLGFVGLVGFAMVDDLPPPTEDVTIELALPPVSGQ